MGGIVAGNLQRHAEIVVDELAGSGAESGLQVAVFHDARWLPMPPVVSLTPAPGGGSRPARCSVRRPRPRRAASTVAHVLAERGVVGYDPRLAEVWPEFAARGKGRVTLRHVLCHTAGVPGLPADTAVADLCDWITCCAALAAAQPWWEPGTRFGYHTLTFGFLFGKTLRRVTGHPISALLREHVTGPLGIAGDLHFGVPAELLSRVARQVAPQGLSAPRPEPGSPLEQATPSGITPGADFANRTGVLTADIPPLAP